MDGKSTVGETSSSILISKIGCQDEKEDDYDCDTSQTERPLKLN